MSSSCETHLCQHCIVRNPKDTYSFGDGRTRLTVLATIDTGDSEVGRGVHISAVVLQEGLQPVIVGIVSDPASDRERVRGVRRRGGRNVVQMLQASRGGAICALGIRCTPKNGFVDGALGQAGGLNSFGEAGRTITFNKIEDAIGKGIERTQ